MLHDGAVGSLEFHLPKWKERRKKKRDAKKNQIKSNKNLRKGSGRIRYVSRWLHATIYITLHVTDRHKKKRMNERKKKTREKSFEDGPKTARRKKIKCPMYSLYTWRQPFNPRRRRTNVSEKKQRRRRKQKRDPWSHVKGIIEECCVPSASNNERMPHTEKNEETQILSVPFHSTSLSSSTRST